MKTVNSRFASLTAAFVAVAMLTFGAAQGAQAADLKILVVNTGAVFQTSLVGKDRNKKLQGIMQAIAADEAKDMEPLRQQAIELQQKKALMGDEFAKKQVELQRTVQFTQYKYEQERTVTQEAAQRLTMAKLYPIYNEIMQEKKGTMLIEQTQLIMVSPDFNITEDVVKRLDAKMPTVDIKRVTWAEIEVAVKAQQEAAAAAQAQ